MEDPWSIAAKPPTMTKSISASQRRCNKLLSSIALLSAQARALRRLELQRHVEGNLMLYCPLLGSETQALCGQAQVDSRVLRNLGGVHGESDGKALCN